MGQQAWTQNWLPQEAVSSLLLEVCKQTLGGPSARMPQRGCGIQLGGRSGRPPPPRKFCPIGTAWWILLLAPGLKPTWDCIQAFFYLPRVISVETPTRRGGGLRLLISPAVRHWLLSPGACPRWESFICQAHEYELGLELC